MKYGDRVTARMRNGRAEKSGVFLRLIAPTWKSKGKLLKARVLFDGNEYATTVEYMRLRPENEIPIPSFR